MDTETGARRRAKTSISKRGLAVRVANAALVATALPTALLVLLLPFKSPDWMLFGTLGLWALGWLLVPPLLLGSLLASVQRRLPGVGARVDGEHLFIGQPEQRIERQDIIGGICVHGVAGPSVELSLRRGGLLRIEMQSEEEALALLRDLGLADAGRAMAHELATTAPAIRVGGSLLVAFLMSLVFGGGLALVQSLLSMHSPSALGASSGIVFLLVAWLATARPAPSQIVLGHDGLLLKGTSQRFIPYSRIASISTTPDGVYLVTTGRALGQRFLLTSERGPRSDALVDELRAAVARAERAEDLDAPARLELLDRGERSLPEWRDALRRLAAPEASYRQSAIERDQLVDAATDLRANKERRVAAALALSHTRDEGAIERVRIAVDGLADQEMRGFMNEALEGTLEDAALEELVAIGEIGKQQR